MKLKFTYSLYTALPTGDMCMSVSVRAHAYVLSISLAALQAPSQTQDDGAKKGRLFKASQS